MQKDEIEQLLHNIAHDVQPICDRFKLHYKLLGNSSDKSLYGFNRGKGKIIRIRLLNRRSGKPRKYSALISTMLHELCHCRYPNHSKSFYLLLRRVTDYARKKDIYDPAKRKIS